MSSLINSNQPVPSYSYNVSYGPIRFKGEGKLEKDLANLEKIISYLDKPDIIENKEGTSRVFTQMNQIQSKVSVRLHRLFNFLFGDHEWYNESRVRKIVKGYSNLPASSKVSEHSKKVLDAYAQLGRIKNGTGTYADGIDRNKLEATPVTTIETLKNIYVGIKFVCTILSGMPIVKDTLNKTAQTLGTLALLSLQAYLKAGTMKDVRNATIGAKAFSLASQLLLDATKELKIGLDGGQQAQKTRPRSRSVC